MSFLSLAPYTAAKAAMDSLDESVSYEVARFGTETSILMPGPFVDGTAHFAHAEFPADATVQEEYATLHGDALAHNEEATRSLFPSKAKGDLPETAKPVALAAFLLGVGHGLAVQAKAGFTRDMLEAVTEQALATWPGR